MSFVILALLLANFCGAISSVVRAPIVDAVDPHDTSFIQPTSYRETAAQSKPHDGLADAGLPPVQRRHFHTNALPLQAPTPTHPQLQPEQSDKEPNAPASHSGPPRPGHPPTLLFSLILLRHAASADTGGAGQFGRNLDKRQSCQGRVRASDASCGDGPRPVPTPRGPFTVAAAYSPLQCSSSRSLFETLQLRWPLKLRVPQRGVCALIALACLCFCSTSLPERIHTTKHNTDLFLPPLLDSMFFATTPAAGTPHAVRFSVCPPGPATTNSKLVEAGSAGLLRDGRGRSENGRCQRGTASCVGGALTFGAS